MTLAIFDLDNTLIAGDSDHAWGEFLCDRGYIDAAEYRAENDRFHVDYQRGQLNIEAYLSFVLAPLAGRSLSELQPIQDEFMHEVIEPMVLSKGLDLLQSHRERGERLLIITATNEFITRPIADRLGVTDLLGCGVEVLDGRITGKGVGTLTYHAGKVKRLREWLAEEGESLAAASFYSDSHNDLPLLEVVDYPVAVDPDPQLLSIAKERDWPVLSLREA